MIVGLITEYNPFHNGHVYHILESKKITKSQHVIAVMSGNFVQRGEPAIFNKYIRTRAALLNGVDIVIELPVLYACASADIFAFGAVDILDKTGIVDSLCFGSEDADINRLYLAAKILSNETYEFKNFIKNEMLKGISYPQARLNALSTLTGEDMSYLSSPNNILSVEYLKALIKIKSHIKAYSIKRYLSEFHDTKIKGFIASATAIRNSIKNKNVEEIKKCVPQNIYNAYLQNIKSTIPSIDDYSDILHYILRTKSPKYISQILDITEGIENLIIKNSNISAISELIKKIKTKRYTYTKLQRGILHIILDIKKQHIYSDINIKPISYIRVLGFRKECSYLLSLLNKNARVPVIMNFKEAEKSFPPELKKQLKAESIITDIYNIANDKKIGKEYTEPIVIV